MSAARGYLIVTEPGRADIEQDTITCCHCNSLVFIKARQDPSQLGGWCGLCAKHICAKCADAGACTPFEKKLESMERRDRLRRAAEG